MDLAFLKHRGLRKLVYTCAQRSMMASGFASRSMSTAFEDLRLLMNRGNGRAALRHVRVNGASILVKVNEDVGRQLYFVGSYEPRPSHYLKQVIRETDICFDIGANLGYYTLLLATLAKAGEVHSFEPVPTNSHLLNLNVLTNGLTNVHVNTDAVADREGEEEFTVCVDGAYSSLRDTGRKPIQERRLVGITTLDAYCRNRGLPRVDFVKIDVEGAEEKVIAGASRLLRDPLRRPRLLMLELYEPMLMRYRSGIESILRTMRDQGYSPFTFAYGEFVPYAKEHYNRYENVLFIHKESRGKA